MARNVRPGSCRVWSAMSIQHLGERSAAGANVGAPKSLLQLTYREVRLLLVSAWPQKAIAYNFTATGRGQGRPASPKIPASSWSSLEGPSSTARSVYVLTATALRAFVAGLRVSISGRDRSRRRSSPGFCRAASTSLGFSKMSLTSSAEALRRTYSSWTTSCRYAPSPMR